MDECIEKLSQQIKCRDSTIKHLYSLLDDASSDEANIFQSIFIYGHVSTGKSLIVKKLLEYLEYNYCIINCLEHASNRSLFEKIIVDLSKFSLNISNNYKLEKRCENLIDFIDRIKSISKDNLKPIVIVFEKCEELRNMSAHLLPAFLRLGELTRTKTCVIFSSDICWEKFKPIQSVYEPIRVYFSQYSQEEMKEILSTFRPNSYDESFYKTYLGLFLSLYFRFCRDLHELKYMAEKNFIEYVKPIESGNVEENDTPALWRNSLNVMKKNLEVIYIRMSTDDFNRPSNLSHEIESTSKLALSFELPYYAKFLLIAAYLASYNPAIEDKRLFMKEGGPKKKRIKKKIQKHKAMTTMMGPKSFPLRRLIAIFCSIIDSKIDLNAILLTQIPTMCQLGLLSSYGESNIDDPKYKCCVSFEFVMIISKNVSFELRRYLHDYMH